MTNIVPFISDGQIFLDTPRAKPFDFTHAKFREDSYLWKTGNCITISFLQTKFSGRGHCRALIEKIKELGYDIFVPRPSARMQMICEKQGFVPYVWPREGENPACEGMKFENNR